MLYLSIHPKTINAAQSIFFQQKPLGIIAIKPIFVKKFFEIIVGVDYNGKTKSIFNNMIEMIKRLNTYYEVVNFRCEPRGILGTHYEELSRH